MAFNRVEKVDDMVFIRNVILSVYDKSGLDEFVINLLTLCPGIRFYSTGGSYSRLNELLAERSGAHLFRMSDYTGQPEMKGGLVKTLDWKIYLGLLSEPYDDDHEEDIKRSSAVHFDMVVCNLYPFKKAADSATGFEEARQYIDIGGASMLRAAAKNFLRVAPVCKPDLYPSVVAALEKGRGALGLEERRRLAARAFSEQAEYDAAVAAYYRDSQAAFINSSYKIGSSE